MLLGVEVLESGLASSNVLLQLLFDITTGHTQIDHVL